MTLLDLLAAVGRTLLKTLNPSFVANFLLPGSQADCSVEIEIWFGSIVTIKLLFHGHQVLVLGV